MTSARIGDIGVGLFILIVAWTAVILMAVFTKLMERWKNYAWLAAGLTLVLTVILVALPIAPQSTASQQAEKDYVFVGRTLLLISMGLSLVIAAGAILSEFVAQPISPLQLSKIRESRKHDARHNVR
ncbi:uncharacterized protein LOC135830019 isoform X2 [Sycon ciliatum]|uniref:uncharacterized protein LOC135830019 isoform X2 n=1 Tax=Sycon ciliatum TaxID=27933 RepID=UPI0031F61CE4